MLYIIIYFGTIVCSKCGMCLRVNALTHALTHTTHTHTTLTHTHTHTHTHAHARTHTHSLTHTLTHSHTSEGAGQETHHQGEEGAACQSREGDPDTPQPSLLRETLLHLPGH